MTNDIQEFKLRREATRLGYNLVRVGDAFDLLDGDGRRAFVGDAPDAAPLSLGQVEAALTQTADLYDVLADDTVPMDKVRENFLRRMAKRQGLELRKSRRRDPRAYDYGTWALVDANTNALVAGDQNSGYGLSLEEVETALQY